jgi:two-component system chemotaxis response regulator CheB
MRAAVYSRPEHVIAIASSTGGPSALLEIFGKIPPTIGAGFVVAQHMPDKFTRTFAERLDRKGFVRTSEAQDGDRLSRCTGFVCPGRQCMSVVQSGVELRVSVGVPTAKDHYVPSADRLFKSVAQAVGKKSIGVVLTGMGDDGLEGARAIHAAGGVVIAEAEETAVVYGMPGSVVRAGLADKVLPLHQIAEYLAQVAGQ